MLYSRITLTLYLLSTTISAQDVDISSSHENKNGNEKIHTQKRDTCETDPNWQPTTQAWRDEFVDEQLRTWWKNLSSSSSSSSTSKSNITSLTKIGNEERSISFARSLGRGFGEHQNGFECGIGAYSTCLAAGCAEYEKNNDPAWSYLALLAVVNLNEFFNSIFFGTTNGQANYISLTNDIMNKFFPPKEASGLDHTQMAFWIVAALTAVFAIPAGLLGAGAVVGAGAVTIGAFAGAGVQHVADSIDSKTENDDKNLEDLADLGRLAAQVGSLAREGVEKWANSTMYGEKDASGNTILNYIKNGSFINDINLPSNADLEKFYTLQMVSRTINAQWKKEKVYITFFKTDDENDASGPSDARYYSKEDGGVYYLYKFTDTGVLSGFVDKPLGFKYLNTSTYSITGQDIIKSSVRAYKQAGFNYTNSLAQQRLIDSMSSNNTWTPYKDAAAWEGLFTIPICDTGINNWNTPLPSSSLKTYPLPNPTNSPSLPCCCGPSCSLTSTFMTTSNFNGSQLLLCTCKSQLSKHPSLYFSSIDYGFEIRSSFALSWASWSTEYKTGVVIGMGVGCLVVLGVLWRWCCLCGRARKERKAELWERVERMRADPDYEPTMM